MSSTDQQGAAPVDRSPAEQVASGGGRVDPGSAVGGFVEPGFEAVRDAFVSGAISRPGGAAFAVYLDGRLVVDLWVGEAAPGRPWQEDTPAVTMSTVKGVAALAAHILVDRGVLDLDAPVATYWPEFAAAGKERVLVRHVLSHTAGVITVPGYLDLLQADGTGWDQADEIARRLASATPLWEPGTKSTYTAFTYGLLLDELIRRVTGKSMREVIQDEIAAPLGIEFRLGAAAGDPVAARRARVILAPPLVSDQPEVLAFQRAFISADDPLGQSLMSNGSTNPIVELDRFINDGPGIEVPLSAATGICTARDLARIYQLLAQGGELDGVRLLSEAAVKSASALEFEGITEFWGLPARWALGFQHSGNMGIRFGRDDSGFGHPGTGGQYGWADPERGLSFAYLRNYLEMQDDLAPMDALYEAIS